METFLLNDGTKIPAIGFGTFQIPADGSTYTAVKQAINFGIRHIDTAVAYFNEQEVGQAVKDSGIPRKDIWLTSKLWLQDYAYEDAKKAIDLSLKKTGYRLRGPLFDPPAVWQSPRSLAGHGRS